MKNTSIAITLGIFLISSTLFVTILKNIVAQQEEEILLKNKSKQKLQNSRTKHPNMLLLLQKYPIWI
jgi:uncharacterized membrane protein YczE